MVKTDVVSVLKASPSQPPSWLPGAGLQKLDDRQLWQRPPFGRPWPRRPNQRFLRCMAMYQPIQSHSVVFLSPWAASGNERESLSERGGARLYRPSSSSCIAVAPPKTLFATCLLRNRHDQRKLTRRPWATLSKRWKSRRLEDLERVLAEISAKEGKKLLFFWKEHHLHIESNHIKSYQRQLITKDVEMYFFDDLCAISCIASSWKWINQDDFFLCWALR